MNNDFAYQELLPLGPDETPYRLLTSDYVTTFEGFSHPWNLLEALVPALEVERHDLSGEYFAWGSI